MPGGSTVFRARYWIVPSGLRRSSGFSLQSGVFGSSATEPVPVIAEPAGAGNVRLASSNLQSAVAKTSDSDADLVLLDPAETREVRAARLHMQTDYTPYEGREVVGAPTHVLVRGKVVHILYVDNGPNELTPPDVGELLILSQSVGRSYEALMKRRKSA